MRPLRAAGSAEGAPPRRLPGSETPGEASGEAWAPAACPPGPCARPTHSQPVALRPPSWAPDLESDRWGALRFGVPQNSPVVRGLSQLLGAPSPGLRRSWKLEVPFTELGGTRSHQRS